MQELKFKEAVTKIASKYHISETDVLAALMQ